MIDSFSGEYTFLSNFSRDPVAGYPTSEHFFQALKSDNLAERSRFKNPEMTPGQAKRAGRKIPMTAEKLEYWNNGGGREEAMAKVIAIKFAPGTALAEKLLATGDEFLKEGNTWHDDIWGNCVCSDPRCAKEGMNLLGYVLMAQRTILRVDALAAAN